MSAPMGVRGGGTAACRNRTFPLQCGSVRTVVGKRGEVAAAVAVAVAAAVAVAVAVAAAVLQDGDVEEVVPSKYVMF